jgi:predicted nucleotidyltransferase
MTASRESAFSPQTGEIIRLLRANMPELQRCYGITYPGLFGCHVRSEQRQRRDLDLLVEFELDDLPNMEIILARMLAELA